MAYDVILTTSIFGEIRIAEPMGPSFLAAVLRARGRKVLMLEPCCEGWTVEETTEVILRNPAPVVGISVHRDKNKPDVLRMLELLRAAGDQRFICLGGHGPTVGIPAEAEFDTLYSRPRYEELGRLADAFILGEGEVSFPALVDRVLEGADWRDLPGVAWVGPDGRMVVNPPPPKIADLDELPFMARDSLDWYIKRYGPPLPASISLGRGCRYRCAFCTVPAFESRQEGPGYRQRSVASVIEEIRHLHERYGVTEFNFEDDNLIGPGPGGQAKVSRLAEAIAGLGFPITFTLFCRPDAVERDLFRRLDAVGLRGVYLGVESVHEPDLAFFGKALTRKQVLEALDVLTELGFSARVGAERRIMLGYITWHPLSSLPQLRASLDFVRRYQAPPKLLRRSLRLYTGVRLKARLEELGLLDPSRPSGWRYRDPRLSGMEEAVDRYFKAVNRVRDRARTVEKAVERYGRGGPAAARLPEVRRELDRKCFDFFEQACAIVEGCGTEGAEADKVLAAWRDECLATLEKELETAGVRTLIDAALAEVGLPPAAEDLFRK